MTYFVGASCSSMSPLMKVAILPAAALVSSAVLERVRFFRRSSSTCTDFWFSDLVLAVFDGTESMISTEGMVISQERDVIAQEGCFEENRLLSLSPNQITPK